MAAYQKKPEKQLNTQAPPPQTISREQYLNSLNPQQRAANVASSQSAFYQANNPAPAQTALPSQPAQPGAYVNTGQAIGVLPNPQVQVQQPQLQQPMTPIGQAMQQPTQLPVQQQPGMINAATPQQQEGMLLAKAKELLLGNSNPTGLTNPLTGEPITEAGVNLGMMLLPGGQSVPGKGFIKNAAQGAEAAARGIAERAAAREAATAARNAPGFIASKGRMITGGELKGLKGAIKSLKGLSSTAIKERTAKLIERFGEGNVRTQMGNEGTAALSSITSDLEGMLNKYSSAGMDAASGKAVPGGVNTVKERLVKKSVLQSIGTFARKNPVMLFNAVAALSFDYGMTANVLNDMPDRLSFANDAIRESKDPVLIAEYERMREDAKNMWKEKTTWIPVAGMIKVMYKGAQQYSKTMEMKDKADKINDERDAEEQAAQEDKFKKIDEAKATAEAEKRQYYEDLSQENERQKLEDRQYWENQTAEKRLYDETTKAYWAGVEEEKQRQKDIDRAYWDGVAKKKEEEAWNAGYSALNF